MYTNDSEQQKIFIDSEEEITTVVEHFRQLQARNVILVVPQHAVLLQSVVNLKLLAQEAQRIKKNIAIMTNDESGMAMAQRAGIKTLQYSSRAVDHNTRIMPSHSSAQNREHDLPKQSYQVPQMQNDVHDARVEKPQRTIGSPMTSPHVYNRPAPPQQRPLSHAVPLRPSMDGHMSMQQRPAPAVQQQHTQTRTQESFVSRPQIRPSQSVQREDIGRTMHQQFPVDHNGRGASSMQNSQMAMRASSRQDIRTAQQREVSRIPVTKSTTQDTMHKGSFHRVENKKEQEIPQRTRFLVKGFIMGGIVLVFLIAAIVILPKSQIIVIPKNVPIDDNVELTARVDQISADKDRRIISARMIERDISYTKTFKSTGVGDAEAQKAQGTITIYNAFDDKPQSLVATTRFLSESGVMFRLAKTITVPGMQGGEPGKIEALVIADKEGSEGNIGPGRFSIPGFDGSPKKEKIYAISDVAMSDGGAGGKGVSIVKSEDIARAQKDMEGEMNRYVHEQISGLLRPESEVLLPDAVRFTIARSEANVGENTMKDEFMYEVVAHVQAMVFAEDEVRAIVADVFADDLTVYGVSDPEIKLAYQNVVVNMEDRTMKMSAHGATVITAQVDLKKFKEDILGKKHDELLSVIEDRYEKTVDKIVIQSVIPPTPSVIAGRVSPIGMMTEVLIGTQE